jgi:hypothetical protein
MPAVRAGERGGPVGYSLFLVRLPTVPDDRPTDLAALAEQLRALEAAGFDLPESYASFEPADAAASTTEPPGGHELNSATVDRMLGAGARWVSCSFVLRGALTPGLADVILQLAAVGRMAVIPESEEVVIAPVDLSERVDLPSLVEDGWPERLVVVASGDELRALLREDVAAWEDHRFWALTRRAMDVPSWRGGAAGPPVADALAGHVLDAFGRAVAGDTDPAAAARELTRDARARTVLDVPEGDRDRDYWAENLGFLLTAAALQLRHGVLDPELDRLATRAATTALDPASWTGDAATSAARRSAAEAYLDAARIGATHRAR